MANVSAEAQSALDRLAQPKWRYLLSAAERKLLSAAAIGEWCRFSEATFSDPGFGRAKFTDAKSWGPERNIRAELVEWLCTDRAAGGLVGPLGLRVERAKFSSRLDLAYLTLPFPLFFIDCWLPGGSDLTGTTIPEIHLDGSWLGPFDQPPAQAEAQADEPSRPIMMNLGAGGSTVIRRKGQSMRAKRSTMADQTGPPDLLHPAKSDAILLAEGLRVSGNISLRDNFHANGEVSLLGADIGGDLTCSAGRFRHEGKTALTAERAHIRGSVHLRRGFTADGGVQLSGAIIEKYLDCSSGHFTNREGSALVAEGVTLGGAAFLRNDTQYGDFTACGRVSLRQAKIGGDLDCDGGKFSSRDVALAADGAKIGGTVRLGKDFDANGEVRLYGMEIDHDLVCTGGSVSNVARLALNAERVKILGDAYLGYPYGRRKQPGWGFEADGAVRLFGASIAGNLICHAGRFHHPDKGEPKTSHSGQQVNQEYQPAIDLEAAKIAGNVLFRFRFNCQGKIRTYGAEIGGDLNFKKVDLSGTSLDLRSSRIKATLFLKEIENAPNAEIDLEGTSCRVLDDSQSWPGKEKIKLDGFTYDRFARYEAIDRLEWVRRCLPETRIEGLRRIPARAKRRGKFRSQPYLQLARVLRADGRDHDARKVLISMAVDRRIWGGLGWWAGKRDWVLWALIGNGYAPFRAVWWLLGLWLAGFLAFGAGYQARLMVPTEQRAHSEFVPKGIAPGWYEPFCALTYAVDTSLPIISLGQRDRWHPDASKPPIEAEGSAVGSPLRDVLCNASFTRDWFSASERCATFLDWFRWIYIPIGWFLTTMFVAGVSGLVGRE